LVRRGAAETHGEGSLLAAAPHICVLGIFGSLGVKVPWPT
jgi:hypothetical protein